MRGKGCYRRYDMSKMVKAGEGVAVSVIVPIYNVEPYLEKCVESIRNQTMREIEIILVDDGSLDGSPQMCDQYAAEDGRIKAIHQPNAGVSVARNRGMDAATADWIMFVDSDDWLEDNAVEVLYSKAAQSNCDMICAPFYNNEDGVETAVAVKPSETGIFHIEDIRNTMLEALLGYEGTVWDKFCTGAVWGRLYKRRALNDECHFPHGMKQREDAIFNLYAALSIKDVQITDIPVYHYYQRAGSVNHHFFPDCQEMIRKVCRFNAESRLFLERFGLMNEYRECYDNAVISGVMALFEHYGFYAASWQEAYAALPELITFCESDECLASIENVRISSIPQVKRVIKLQLLKHRMYKTFMMLKYVWGKWKKLAKGNPV